MDIKMRMTCRQSMSHNINFMFGSTKTKYKEQKFLLFNQNLSTCHPKQIFLAKLSLLTAPMSLHPQY